MKSNWKPSAFIALGVLMLVVLHPPSRFGYSESAPAPTKGKLKFGPVGIYWVEEGSDAPQFLFFGGSSDSKTQAALEKEYQGATKTSGKARFYTYGLDMSKATGLGFGPLPPHLAEWGCYTIDNQWNVNGRYSVLFTPIAGYDQPVYEINFTGIDPAKFPDGYKMIALQLPGKNRFYFRFR